MNTFQPGTILRLRRGIRVVGCIPRPSVARTARLSRFAFSVLFAAIFATPAAQAQSTWSGASGASGTASFTTPGNWAGGSVPASGTASTNQLFFQNGVNPTISNISGTFNRIWFNSLNGSFSGTASSWTLGTLGDPGLFVGGGNASISYSSTNANQTLTINMPFGGAGGAVNVNGVGSPPATAGRLDLMGGLTGSQQFNTSNRVRIGGTSTSSGLIRIDSGMTTLLTGSAVTGGVSSPSSATGVQRIQLGNGATNTGVLGLTTASGDLVRQLSNSGAGGIGWTNTSNGGFAAVDSDRSVTFATSASNATPLTGLTWGTTTGFIGASGTLMFGNAEATGNLTFVNNISLGNASGTTRFIQVNRGSSSVADGTLSGIVSGTANLTKTGTGWLRMTGANTFTGTTFVNAGRLEVAGAGSLTNAPVVVNGAGAELKWNSSTAFARPLTLTQGTISGTGTISATGGVTIGTNAVISPGNSPGTLPITTGLVLSSTGTYLWEINNATGSKGTNWDVVNVSGGTLDLTALSSAAKFKLDLTTLSGTASGPMDGYVAGSSYRWRIFDAATLALPGSFGPTPYASDTNITSLFDLTFTNWQNTPKPATADVTVRVASDGNGIDLVVVPEPATLALAGLGIGVAGFAVWRRRGRRSA